MATIVADIIYKASEKGMSKVQKQLKGIDKASQNTSKSVAGLTKAAKLSAAVLVAMGTAMGALTKQALDQADVIGKTADKIGLSTDALQELRFAADIAGVSTKTLDMSMQRFTRRIGEADQGTGVLSKTFKDLGIETRDLEGNLKSTETLLNEYADAIQGTADPAEQLRLTFQAMDSEGAALVNMLRNGKKGLDDLRKSARDAGVVLEEDLIRSAEQINDQWTKVSAVFSTKFTSALLTAAQAAGDFFNMFNDAESIGRKIEAIQQDINDEIRKQNELIDEGGFLANHRIGVHEQNIAGWKKERDALQEQLDVKIRLDEAQKNITAGMVAESAATRQSIADKEEILTIEEEALQILKEHSETLQHDNLLMQEAGLLFSENAISLEEYIILLREAGVASDDLSLEATLTGNKDELDKAAEDMKKWTDIAQGGVKDLSDSFVSSALTGKESFGDMASSILANIAEMIAQQLFFNMISSALGGTSFGGLLGFDKGGAFPSASKFDKGSEFSNKIHRSPTKFAFGGGLGVMAEKSPEAVMPLARTSTGELGIRSTGDASAGNNVEIGSINIKVDGNDNQTGAEQGQAISRELVNAINSMIDGRVQEQRRVGNTLNPVAQVI